MKSTAYFCIAIFILLVLPLKGQQTEVRFHPLGVEQGLSHSLVSAIAEDSMGFIWFGTQDGLNRYDGYEFKSYFKGNDKRSPSDSWIHKLYIDQSNQMWIWYSGQGIERYDPYTETFHPYLADSTLPGSLVSTSYASESPAINNEFFEDSDGILWIGTEGGLHRYNREEDSFEVFRHSPDDPGSLSDNHISYLAEDYQGKLWVGTFNGLNRLDRESGSVIRFMSTENSDKHLNNNNINFIYCHPDGSLWVGTSQGGLNIIENPGEEKMKVHHLIDTPLNPNLEPSIYNIIRSSTGHMFVASHHGLYKVIKTEGSYREMIVPETSGVRVFHILEDSKAYLWISSNNNMDRTLFRLWPDLETVETFYFEERDPFVFNGGWVQFLHESRTGLLWIATEKKGVYMVDLNARQFKTIDNYRERGLYISNKEVYSIYEDPYKKLYIGTKNELNRINLKDGSWYGFNNRYNLKRNLRYDYSPELSSTFVGVIKEHVDGRIWLGSFDYKVSLYDPVNSSFLNFHQNEEDPTHFRGWSLRSICVTSKKQVYFGATEHGLARLREDGLSFDYFPVVGTGNPRGTNDEHIQYIYEDRSGILWLGTLKGLNRFDPDQGTFQHFVNVPDDKNSLSNNRVKCILEPEIHGEDILWIGTNNGGLNRFEKNTGNFTSFTINDGLPSNTIHGILEDKEGNLWLSTNRGLVQFDPLTERILVYTAEDGLVGNEFNEGAFFKNREGIMYFGGTNGVTYFNPEEIKEKALYDARVVITAMNLSGTPVLPFDTINGRVVLDRSISFTDEITLTHRDRFLSFEFASLDYAAPNKIKYRYILDGFEDNWNEADASQRFLNYTNIPSGTYTLEIMGTNSDGNWSRNYTSIAIHILPPFWQTTWFKLIMATAVLLVLLAIIQIRTRILKNQKKHLEEEVEARTLDLKEVNRLLENKQEEIVVQNEKIARQRDNLSEQNTRLEDQNKEIQQMAERLHESDQMKLKFFTNISHEFRTPLTLIMGPTEKLLKRDDFSNLQTVKKELELIYRNERRLFKLINQLLEVRRVETGNLKLAVAEDDLVKYLGDIYQLFMPYAEKKQIDFRFEADPSSILVYFDADKMEKIIYNLLSNAFKHTPVNGEIVFSVNKVHEGEVEWIRMAVSDSGPGIPREHLTHIFDRFYQISNKHQSARISSGIGLSLSKDLVEKHYGRISVLSDSEEGTRFEVFIPSTKEMYKDHEILVEPETDLTMEYISSMLETYEYSTNEDKETTMVDEDLFRILVVEDNLDLQKFLYNEMSESYNVMLAQNGEEGFLISKQNLPDLIISDIMMPEMDGLEFCKRLKEDVLTSHIPVILLTAKTGSENQMLGFECGADDYITKPFNPDILKLKIRNILEGRKQMAKQFSGAANYIPDNIKITQIDQGFLEKFIKLVEDNIDDTELSGDRMACELGMSKGNLYKKLKTLTGMTVNIFIRTIRLKVAANLLKQGNYNISEIAYAVGFNNPKYFSTCFSEMYSVSPKEYMK